MGVVILVLVVIAALSAIGSGVWVATALVSAISRNRGAQTAWRQANEKSNERDL